MTNLNQKILNAYLLLDCSNEQMGAADKKLQAALAALKQAEKSKEEKLREFLEPINSVKTLEELAVIFTGLIKDITSRVKTKPAKARVLARFNTNFRQWKSRKSIPLLTSDPLQTIGIRGLEMIVKKQQKVKAKTGKAETGRAMTGRTGTGRTGTGTGTGTGRAESVTSHTSTGNGNGNGNKQTIPQRFEELARELLTLSQNLQISADDVNGLLSALTIVKGDKLREEYARAERDAKRDAKKAASK